MILVFFLIYESLENVLGNSYVYIHPQTFHNYISTKLSLLAKFTQVFSLKNFWLYSIKSLFSSRKKWQCNKVKQFYTIVVAYKSIIQSGISLSNYIYIFILHNKIKDHMHTTATSNNIITIVATKKF